MVMKGFDNLEDVLGKIGSSNALFLCLEEKDNELLLANRVN